MSQSQEPQNGKVVGISDTGIIWICYALHLLSLFCGGITSIIALIINYIKRSDARKGLAGPLALSHMEWQINTFWLTLLFVLILSLASFLLLLGVVGMIFIYPLWIGLLVWYVYRILRGMLALNSGLNVPV